MRLSRFLSLLHPGSCGLWSGRCRIWDQASCCAPVFLQQIRNRGGCNGL